MNSQDPLFHEDFRDALRHAIKALGGFETVGHDLWPTRSRKQAGNWLADCLNSERPAKLDLEDIVTLLAMARARGIHCAMHQLADDAGYAQPNIAPAKTPRQQLAEQMERAVAEVRRLANEEAALAAEGEK